MVNREGVHLGQVRELLATGPQTVLVLEYQEAGKAQERMLPFVSAYVDAWTCRPAASRSTGKPTTRTAHATPCASTSSPLFPELFAPFLAAGVTRRAYETRQVDVRLWNLRDFAEGNYRRVDDRPFGGGPGMVMLAEPLARCLAAVKADRGDAAPVVLFSPVGERSTTPAWRAGPPARGAVLLCGRYEGIDQRFIDTHVDVQLSLGDFVLSGGEIAAMACWTPWRGCSLGC